MFLTANDIIRFTMFHSLLGQTCINRLDFLFLSADSAPAVMEVSGLINFADDWHNTIRLVTSEALTFVKAQVDNLNTGEFLEYSYPAASTGDLDSGSVVPSNVCASVRKLRGNRTTRTGWVRIAGLVEAQVAGNILSSTVREYLDDEFTRIMASEYVLVQPSPANEFNIRGIISHNPPVLGEPPVVYQNVTGISTREFVGSQNTRKPRASGT